MLPRPPHTVSLAELLTLGYLSDGDVRPDGHVADARRRCAERHFLEARRAVSLPAPAPRRPAVKSVRVPPVKQGTSEAEADVLCCCICLTHRKEYAVVPCFHMCVCAGCGARRIRQCPLCRGPVDRLQRIFV